MQDPPDRSHVLTEQRNPRSMGLDALSTEECVRLINEEDAAAASAVGRAAPALCAFIDAAEERLREGGRLVYVGAGTSGRLGVLDAAELPPTFQWEHGRAVAIIAGGDAALRRSSESREDERDGAREELETIGVGARDAVLGIAAGGTTPYVLGALEWAHGLGAHTGLLTCASGGGAAYIGTLIEIATGPEVVTGSTRMKAGVATKMALHTISTTLMVRMGKVYENLMVDLRATNAKLRDRAARIVRELTGLDRGAALALLDEAGGEAKVAIVMGRLGLGAEEARARLDAADGALRAALEGKAGS